MRFASERHQILMLDPANWHLPISYENTSSALRTYSEQMLCPSNGVQSMNAPDLSPLRRCTSLGTLASLAMPITLAALATSAAYAGADNTFAPALQKSTDFLEGSGGKTITVLSLAAGLIGLASGRFTLAQIAVPVGVGIGVGTGVPIVTSVVTAVI
jgi:conjugal transfer pilus assembly protein TraA